VLLLAKGFRQNDYKAMLAEVRDRCPALRLSLVLDEDWKTLVDSGHGVAAHVLELRERSLQFDDPINIQYTSGTTGFPKGRRCRTTTSSTTASSWPRRCG